MLRLLFFLTALGFLSAALAGCHAEVGGGVGDTAAVSPAR